MKEAFINTTPPKHTEVEKEWLACQMAGLQKWRKEALARLWKKKGVDIKIPDNILISDSCLVPLAKDKKRLQDLPSLKQFLSLGLHVLLAKWKRSFYVCKKTLSKCWIQPQILS